ncbi:hypothetical protein [Pararhizobium sp. IMCC21322]|uniref:hypothetical protein n=1 Tax=Pararhizobium sp. IMCC21322 TaxID=3067903 RepID=UPI0027411AFB|nr:hypothetical protein [Pararhizobium sp. IMCC21322]
MIETDRLFVNWADYPSVAAFNDGTMAVHWLIENGSSSFDYNVNVALSSDKGRSWRAPIVPHSDRSQQQHGFVTLLPTKQNLLMAVWLDGRAYETDGNVSKSETFTNAMQLRTTTIGSDGSLSEDALLDIRTCSCCQTAAAITESGAVLVAYRDRTAQEIRDISVVRLSNGKWSKPKTIHEDGWKIAGCPVNGPSIDANGERVALAWYTAANDAPMVQVAFSKDAGQQFESISRVDLGEASGRVDIVQLDDGSALVSWVELRDDGEALLVCRAWPGTGCGATQVMMQNQAGGSINFPRMAYADGQVYFAWTQPVKSITSSRSLGSTVKMLLARF